MANETPQQGTATTTPSAAPTITVTQDELNSMVEKAVQGHLNGVHAKITRLEKAVPVSTTQQTTTTTQKDDDPPTLKERIAAVEKQTTASAKLARTVGLKAAAEAAKVPESRFKYFQMAIEAEYGKGLTVDGETGQLVYTNELGETQQLTEIAKAFVAKPEGEIFRPPVQVPSAGGLRGGRTTPTNRPSLFDMAQNDPDAFSKLTPEQKTRMAHEDSQRLGVRDNSTRGGV